MYHGRGISLAITAGVMAALGSTSAKLAMTTEAVNRLCLSVLLTAVGLEESASIVVCDSVSMLLRVMFFAGIFVFNAMMWTFYTKSLQFCSSSVEATVTNAASNFFFTAVFGGVLFEEHFPILWWIGSSLILAGIVLINQGNAETDKEAKKDR